MPTPKRVNNDDFEAILQATFDNINQDGSGLQVTNLDPRSVDAVLSRVSAITSSASERLGVYFGGALESVHYSVPSERVNTILREAEDKSLSFTIEYSYTHTFKLKPAAAQRMLAATNKKSVARKRRNRSSAVTPAIDKSCYGGVDSGC